MYCHFCFRFWLYMENSISRKFPGFFHEDMVFFSLPLVIYRHCYFIAIISYEDLLPQLQRVLKNFS